MDAEEDTIITSDNVVASSKNHSVLESDAACHLLMLGLIEKSMTDEEALRILKSFGSKVARHGFTLSMR